VEYQLEFIAQSYRRAACPQAAAKTQYAIRRLEGKPPYGGVQKQLAKLQFVLSKNGSAGRCHFLWVISR